MLFAPIAIAVVATARAIPARRWVFWWSWSKPLAVIGVIGTVAILSGVSYAGIGVGYGATSTFHFSLLQQFLLAGAAQAGLRHSAAKGRGSSLALGRVRGFHGWIAEWIEVRALERWVADLNDEQLVVACARLDRHGAGKPAVLQERVRAREEQERLLAKGGAYRDAARLDMELATSHGYTVYELRKPNV